MVGKKGGGMEEGGKMSRLIQCVRVSMKREPSKGVHTLTRSVGMPICAQERLDRARLCAEEVESDALRGTLLARLQSHTAGFSQISSRVRRAVIGAKSRNDEAKAREREALLGATSWETVTTAKQRKSVRPRKNLAPPPPPSLDGTCSKCEID